MHYQEEYEKWLASPLVDQTAKDELAALRGSE